MKTICAWCNKVLVEGPEADDQASHGICPKCQKIELAKIEKYLKEQAKEEGNEKM